MTTQEQLIAVKAAKSALTATSTAQKNRALLAMADALLADAAPILAANQEDLDAARGTISEVMLDRLALNQARLEGMVVARMVTAAAAQGKKIAAICAAPTVLAKLGLLNGREAVCYPSCRENLVGAVPSAQPVVVSGNFITGEALGSAIPFALELAAQLTGRENAEAVAKAICCNW